MSTMSKSALSDLLILYPININFFLLSESNKGGLPAVEWVVWFGIIMLLIVYAAHAADAALSPPKQLESFSSSKLE